MDMPLSSVAMGPDAWHDRSGGYAALGSAGAQELAAKRWLDRWGGTMFNCHCRATRGRPCTALKGHRGC